MAGISEASTVVSGCFNNRGHQMGPSSSIRLVGDVFTIYHGKSPCFTTWDRIFGTFSNHRGQANLKFRRNVAGHFEGFGFPL